MISLWVIISGKSTSLTNQNGYDDTAGNASTLHQVLTEVAAASVEEGSVSRESVTDGVQDSGSRPTDTRSS